MSKELSGARQYASKVDKGLRAVAPAIARALGQAKYDALRLELGRHLHTRVGASAPCNLDLLDSAAAVLRSLQGPWILGGDFNAPKSGDGGVYSLLTAARRVQPPDSADEWSEDDGAAWPRAPLPASTYGKSRV